MERSKYEYYWILSSGIVRRFARVSCARVRFLMWWQTKKWGWFSSFEEFGPPVHPLSVCVCTAVYYCSVCGLNKKSIFLLSVPVDRISGKMVFFRTLHYQHWSTQQLWDSTPIIWRISSFILAPEVIGVLATRYCALFFIFYAI